jgi:hypothetical protein
MAYIPESNITAGRGDRPGVGASLVIATDEPFQQRPVVLIASDFLPKSMLSAEGYTVNERITNDGLQNTYSMKTDYVRRVRPR